MALTKVTNAMQNSASASVLDYGATGDGVTDDSAAVQAAQLTIESGVITVTDSVHRVDTEAFAASDDLDTINGGSDGYVLILKSFVNARDVTLKDGTGNLLLAGDFVLSNTNDTIMLRYDALAAGWIEISRSDNTV